MTLLDTLGVVFEEVTPERVVASMEVTDALVQPHGYLHGGATIALLESAASQGAQLWADLATELPFGTGVDVAHRQSARLGDRIKGVAQLRSETPSSVAGRKQLWAVEAVREDGAVVSCGTVTVKIVPISRLREKEAEAMAKTQGEGQA